MGKRQMKLGSLKINGLNDSEVNAHDLVIDTLYLELNNSHARLPESVNVNKLKGSMANRSTLLARNMMQIEFERDSTSFIQ
jgi:hypothetical protein